MFLQDCLLFINSQKTKNKSNFLHLIVVSMKN